MINMVTLVSLIFAIQIRLSDILFVSIAKILTKYENYEKPSQQKSSFIYKIFLFKFVNNYNVMFFVIFLKIY